MASRNIGETSELYISSYIINNPREIGEEYISEIHFKDGCIKTSKHGLLPKEKNLPRRIDFLTISEIRQKYGSNKSFIGSPPTIFNASKTMNVEYNVILNDNDLDLNTLEGLAFKDRMTLVSSLIDPIYTETLRSRAATCELNIISSLILGHHFHDTKFVSDISILFELEREQIKQFLYDSFLGKFHGGGDNIDFVSFEVIKNIGHIINLNNGREVERFKELLFCSSYMEKPSRSRHSYGFFFIENDVLKIKFCPQIRLNPHKVKNFLQPGDPNG